jgi:hypothetical protein
VIDDHLAFYLESTTKKSNAVENGEFGIHIFVNFWNFCSQVGLLRLVIAEMVMLATHNNIE